ncbi:MAG: hypothetical protein IKU49_03440 [Prevotella sp.]|nr:hypothetical protein [Prevotella sp.]
MVIKRKHIVIVVLTLCGIAVLAWAIGNYMAKRAKQEQYQQALAQRFDKAMTIAYPLFENYVLVMEDRADSIEALAKRSEETDSLSFNAAFGLLWEKYVQTQGARKGLVLLEEYEYFRISPLLKMLMDSGEKRQKETEAIQRITSAGDALVEPYLHARQDSLMSITKRARQFLSDGLEVLKPYRSENTNYRSWRDIR